MESPEFFVQSPADYVHKGFISGAFLNVYLTDKYGFGKVIVIGQCTMFIRERMLITRSHRVYPPVHRICNDGPSGALSADVCGIRSGGIRVVTPECAL